MLITIYILLEQSIICNNFLFSPGSVSGKRFCVIHISIARQKLRLGKKINSYPFFVTTALLP